MLDAHLGPGASPRAGPNNGLKYCIGTGAPALSHRKSAKRSARRRNKSLVQWFGQSAKRVSKLLRRLRKMSARQLTEKLPGVSKQLQRMRYRRWRGLADVAGATGTSRPPRPDFIIIGAPKCGTSWLQSVLNQHPNVIMVPDEIEYFSAHYDYPVEWYLEHFARRLTSAKDAEPTSYVLGEKSAHYCSMSQDRIQRVRDLLPDARLVLMTRDPVTRHWANAKRFFEKRRLRNREAAVLALPRGKLFEFFTRTRPLGEFSKIIANWTTIFPPGQLLILSQERTLASPRVTFDAVLEHIGIATDYDPASLTFMSRQKNRGPKIDMPDDVAEFLEDMFASERQRLRDLFGDKSFVYVS